MEAAGNGIEKQNKNVRSGAPNESCVGVPSDEEEQQEFFNAFHMVCTLTHIHIVRNITKIKQINYCVVLCFMDMSK